MNDLEFKIVTYLEKVKRGEVTLPDLALDEIADTLRAQIHKGFSEDRIERSGVFRLSALGRPYCQLWFANKGEKGEEPDYSFPIKMMMGDMLEALMITILRECGANVQEVHTPVKLPIRSGNTGTAYISGTLDVVIDGKVWDIKTASPFSFSKKFQTFETVKDDDVFGYVPQGFGYAVARGLPFGGWIVIEKSTGDIKVVEAPIIQDKECEEAIERLTETFNLLKEGAAFMRCFEDIPEYFQKKATGNRILPIACTFCDWKYKCWPGVQHLPQVPSKAEYPRWYYYTHIDEKWNEDTESEGEGQEPSEASGGEGTEALPKADKA